MGREPLASSLTFPFFKELVLPLGWFFIVVGAFVIVGAGNAVNLTDGLDGLATVPVIIVSLSFGVIAYLAGNAFFADYLQIHYVAGTGELAVLCGAVIGAGLGFLWFNAPPASIFMGDTGSLALGGMIGTIAVATKHEIVLAVIGGLFVLEAVSVIVQVAVVQADRQARVPDGAAASSLRAEGLDRAADRDPLLDHRGGPRARRPLDAEAAVSREDVGESTGRQRHGLLPPPLRGRGGEGGISNCDLSFWLPPSLTLPLKGGGDTAS